MWVIIISGQVNPNGHIKRADEARELSNEALRASHLPDTATSQKKKKVPFSLLVGRRAQSILTGEERREVRIHRDHAQGLRERRLTIDTHTEPSRELLLVVKEERERETEREREIHAQQKKGLLTCLRL